MSGRRNGYRRIAKDWAKEKAAEANTALERLSIRIQPVHYYSETPSRRALATSIDTWAKPMSMVDIDWDLDTQLAWLATVTAPYIAEVHGLRGYETAVSSNAGPGYGPIEAEVLHCVVRSVKPSHVLEVGSGISSLVTGAALSMNRDEGSDGRLVCIEPYARPGLRAADRLELHEVPVQEAPRSLFDALGPGDVLFIDSTHALKTGSELTLLYLEVLPRLAEGVIVHIHDIFLPYAYSPYIMSSLFDWQESAFVAALLSGSSRYSVLACLSALHIDRQAEMKELIADYDPVALDRGLARTARPQGHYPSSLWLRVGADVP